MPVVIGIDTEAETACVGSTATSGTGIVPDETDGSSIGVGTNCVVSRRGTNRGECLGRVVQGLERWRRRDVTNGRVIWHGGRSDHTQRNAASRPSIVRMGIVVVGRPAKHSDRLRHRINHDEAREKWRHPVGSGVTQRARGAGRRTRFIPVFRFTRLCLRILETWRLRNTTDPVRRQSCASAVIRVSDRRRVIELATEWNRAWWEWSASRLMP
jgi:hypothetical protein